MLESDMNELDLQSWAVLLAGIGVALVLAEVLLPTHGVLGVLGTGGLVAAIVICYVISVRLGTLVLIAAACATPLLWIAFVRIWPRTPIGRRIVLPRVVSPVSRASVLVGQRGVTVSEMRPIGVCEFDLPTGINERIEAISEHGLIPPGRPIAVVDVANNRPVVRECT